MIVIKMEVKTVTADQGGNFLVLLMDDEEKKVLPIAIGPLEAQAIALELENIKPPRPMTHDLLRNVIQSFDTFVKYIFINELKDGTFFAQIVYDHEGNEIVQDARPSDAIALAIRFSAPIFVAPEVLNEAGIITEEMEKETAAAYKEAKAPVTSQGKETTEDKIKNLEKRLKNAIKDEDYEKAAQIRDELNKLKG